MSVSPIDNRPKKFLKKGEGLKRFAAYNPPLPTTTKKCHQRRKTFVKFKLDNFYPDILNDESINLSTEIPKIPPPKIIHTPIKPSRQALGAHNYNDSKSEQSPNIDPPSRRYNTRARKALSENVPSCETTKREPKTRRKLKAVVERYERLPATDGNPTNTPAAESGTTELTESQISGNIDDLLEKVAKMKAILGDKELNNSLDQSDEEASDGSHEADRLDAPQKTNQVHFDLSTPQPGSYILALGQQIQQIESTVNELKEIIKNCTCGKIFQSEQPSTKPGPIRKTTRSKASTVQTRPPAK